VFTGIIEELGTVREISQRQLDLSRPSTFDDLKPGSSIAVSGVCLTIVKLDHSSIAFDLSPETLKRTTLGGLKKGDMVNLERAVKADGRFEGHIVQGHVDCVGRVGKVRKEGKEGTTLTVSYPRQLQGFIVEKGSIAVDGVSLTVVACRLSLTAHSFSVALIPHTLQTTTLGSLKVGDSVNLETDILGKYARR
jgi:riboflavin synthase